MVEPEFLQFRHQVAIRLTWWTSARSMLELAASITRRCSLKAVRVCDPTKRSQSASLGRECAQAGHEQAAR
eukprot:1806354-Rhodomonas_salina.1